MLTLGTAGAYYQDAHTTAFQDTFRVKSVDSTGASDTFTGFFLAGMTQGCDAKQAMRRAAAAAAISVSRQRPHQSGGSAVPEFRAGIIAVVLFVSLRANPDLPKQIRICSTKKGIIN